MNPIDIFKARFYIGERVTWPALGDVYPAGSGEVLSIWGDLNRLWCRIKADIPVQRPTGMANIKDTSVYRD